jgi:hypothetical protein
MISRTTTAGTRNRPQTEPTRVLLALTAPEARLLERSTVLFAAAIAPYARDVDDAGSPLRSARRKLGRALRLAAVPGADEDGPAGTKTERPRARGSRPGARRAVAAKHM